uniref:Uncharacterized protein n=1 Tax=Lepeophtheirus salmonis TaxID=72036 RepID=A0A0K2URU6_LEPSM
MVSNKLFFGVDVIVLLFYPFGFLDILPLYYLPFFSIMGFIFYAYISAMSFLSLRQKKFFIFWILDENEYFYVKQIF